MKITKTEFDKIIKEEVSSALNEIEYLTKFPKQSPKPQKGPGVAGGLPGISRMAKKLPPIKKSDKQVVKKDVFEGVETIKQSDLSAVAGEYAAKRAFQNSITPEDLQSVAAAMSGYRVLDNKNPGAIRSAIGDPKAILLVGTTAEHVYFKTMDDKYFRMPKSNRALEENLYEDGHEDVPSAKRAMQTIIEDAGEMLQVLEQMDGTLPTWWTNKMAVASQTLNKMRDYLLVPTENLSEVVSIDDCHKLIGAGGKYKPESAEEYNLVAKCREKYANLEKKQMKITKSELKQTIKEEINSFLQEESTPPEGFERLLTLLFAHIAPPMIALYPRAPHPDIVADAISAVRDISQVFTQKNPRFVEEARIKEIIGYLVQLKKGDAEGFGAKFASKDMEINGRKIFKGTHLADPPAEDAQSTLWLYLGFFQQAVKKIYDFDVQFNRARSKAKSEENRLRGERKQAWGW